MPLSIFFNIAYIKTFWKVKINLYCRNLPITVQTVFNFDVNFGAIKRAAPGIPLIRNRLRSQGILQRCCCLIPTRFLTDSALKPGDTFVPLAVSSDKDYTGVSAAAYALNSDMEGGVIVTTFSSFGRNVTQDRQGQICPRAYLIALQAGIQRMFWYEFQAVEHDPFYNEHHFGMVHRDLSPKPAYTAVKALTRARPAGSQNAKHNWRSEDGAFYFPHWRRPDGKMAWALWKAERSQSCSLAITGSVTEAFDHLGAPVTVSVRNGEVQIDVTESILYLVGPENVAVTVIDTP